MSEIEQEFYKVFEISPATVQEYGATYFWDTIEIDGKRYTPIDDRKLLEIICILNKEAVYGYSDWGGNFIIGETVEEIKESILTDCIRDKSKVFKQIRQLFKEDNQSMSEKYIIKNCPAIKEITTLLTSESPQFQKEWCCYKTGSNFLKKCQDCTDCVMKQTVEKCSKAHGQIIGYEKGKIYDGENLIEANLPLATINTLAKELLDLLDIEEVE